MPHRIQARQSLGLFSLASTRPRVGRFDFRGPPPYEALVAYLARGGLLHRGDAPLLRGLYCSPNFWHRQHHMAKKPKRTNLKGPGKCIFCGAFGLTHEHVWADWLKAYIPRVMESHNTRLAFLSVEKDEDVRIQKKTGDPHSRRIYCVCQPCNNGWMSVLQEDAKPFIVPMLKGETTRLHRRAQKTLAAWIAMTTMVAEYINREFVAVPAADRLWLKEKSEAPKGWRIWIGAHCVEKFALYSHNALEMARKGERFTPGPAIAPNTQTTTMCIGKYFVFHVMSSTVGWEIIRRWPLPGQVSRALHQIWPIRDNGRISIVDWSIGTTLDDKGMHLLADQFMQASQRHLRSLSDNADRRARA
jgi:hypothetical protein